MRGDSRAHSSVRITPATSWPINLWRGSKKEAVSEVDLKEKVAKAHGCVAAKWPSLASYGDGAVMVIFRLPQRRRTHTSRIVASLDRKRLGAGFWGEAGSRSEAFSMRRLGGSRWRLRRTRCAMGFEPQLVTESTTGRALAKRSGGGVIVERVAGASRGVRGAVRGNVSPWGRHTNVSACRNTSLGR